jgi:hypothetical protein
MTRRILHVGPCRWSGVPLLLPGLERPPRKPSPVPRGQSSFEFFFRPILGSLSAYWWLDPPLSFGDAVVPELEELWEKIVDDRWARPGTVLPGLANYVLNDWCEFIGLLERPTTTVARDFRDGKRSIWQADLTFRNVDGALWLMHSRDEQLYAAVEGYLHKIPEAKCFYEDLNADG